MVRLLYILKSPDSGTGGDDNMKTLLDKIEALETRMKSLEVENSNLKKANEQIVSLNRQLLDRTPTSNNTNTSTPDDSAKTELDKYLKGE